MDFVTEAWYNEYCHLSPALDVSRWRCRSCSLWHFFCTQCGHFKTIPDAWEETSLWTLNKRQVFMKSAGWICDPCWFAFREKIRVVPKPEPKIYVYSD